MTLRRTVRSSCPTHLTKLVLVALAKVSAVLSL